ncbi:glycosyltransferase family 2 protein [bacterium]|nr:glycosyltransferase family 2 protein [bacterium]
MKVSVIIPTYNCERFLQESIGSLLKQTFTDFEIIVVDNKSTDNTVKKIKDFMTQDSKISLIELEKNYKQGIARNIGVEKAQGEYIMFVDGDDKVSPDFIEKMYNKISTDNADITICRWAPFDNRTGKINYKHGFANFHRLPEKYKTESFTWRDIKDEVYSQSNVPWDKIYKKSFLLEKDIKFPGGMFFEDNVFSFDALMKATKITIVDECLIYYRVNRKQAVTARCDETFFDYIKTFTKIKENLEKQNLYEEMKYNFINYKVRSLFWWWKKINFKYKKKFFEIIKKDFLNMYNNELLTIPDKRGIWTKTFFLINRVLDNNFFEYLLYLYWDRIYRVEIGIDYRTVVILSNFQFWYNNYDDKRVFFD